MFYLFFTVKSKKEYSLVIAQDHLHHPEKKLKIFFNSANYYVLNSRFVFTKFQGDLCNIRVIWYNLILVGDSKIFTQIPIFQNIFKKCVLFVYFLKTHTNQFFSQKTDNLVEMHLKTT